MKFPGIITAFVLGLAGLAIVAGVGFIVYLNWAFTPRRGPSAPPTYQILASGPAGDSLFYCIRKDAGPDGSVIYEVRMAKDLASAKQQGSILVRCVNSPIPVSVRRKEPGFIEVEMDRPFTKDGVTGVRIPINSEGEGPGGAFQYFEDGVLANEKRM